MAFHPFDALDATHHPLHCPLLRLGGDHPHQGYLAIPYLNIHIDFTGGTVGFQLSPDAKGDSQIVEFFLGGLRRTGSVFAAGKSWISKARAIFSPTSL